MTTAEEVIDLVDSSDDDDETQKTKADEDIVVLVKTVKPQTAGSSAACTSNSPQHRAGGEKRTIVSNPYIKSASPKRPRKSSPNNTSPFACTTLTSQDKKAISVQIDNDGSDHGQTVPGIFPPKHEWLKSKNTTCRIVQFIGQKDNWSCGYRNLQMILSSLLPNILDSHTFHSKYPRRSDQITIPSIAQIQTLIETAWQNGFDPEGATHFRHKLRGKRCFIGAVEVHSALSFWGFDATIIQFIRCPESRQALPRFVKAYFSKALGRLECPICCSHPTSCAADVANRLLAAKDTTCCPSDITCQCPMLPLYFQWEGHSITIVGMDESKDEFLVFNPQHKKGPSRLKIAGVITKDTQILMVSSFRSLSALEQKGKKIVKEFPTANLPAVMSAIQRSGGRY